MGQLTAHFTAAGAALVVGLMAGCSQYPDQIAAADVPNTQYLGRSCRELVSQRNDVAVRLEATSAAQTAEADEESKLAALVTLDPLMAPFLAVGFAADADHAAQIATLKGHYAAISSAGQEEGCFPNG